MRFIYPSIVKKVREDYYEASMPDLAGCTATGDDIDEVLENMNAAVFDWITLELEDHDELPPVSHPADLKLEENEFVRNISVAIRMMEGWDE